MMDRRNFFRSMIGGVAAAAAVRTWPFRVFSFPNELKILNPIVGQTVYTTAAGSNNYFALNEAAVQAIELENVLEQIPDLLLTENMLYQRLLKNGRMRYRWVAMDPACKEDSESARTINKLMSMGLLK